MPIEFCMPHVNVEIKNSYIVHDEHWATQCNIRLPFHRERERERERDREIESGHPHAGKKKKLSFSTSPIESVLSIVSLSRLGIVGSFFSFSPSLFRFGLLHPKC